MIEKKVAAGLSSPQNTVGLTGLIPFEVVTLAEAKVKPAPGVLRLFVDLPPGTALVPERPVSYRVHAGEAGFEIERHGRIVNVQGATLPLVLPYAPREYPAPPARSEIAVDFTFWHTDGTRLRGQDVQWRMPIRWDATGTTSLDLRFVLPD